jgi:hypothetical protein
MTSPKQIEANRRVTPVLDLVVNVSTAIGRDPRGKDQRASLKPQS